MSAADIAERTPKFRPSEIEVQPLIDTAEPQLVALAGDHFVEAIVGERAAP